METKPDLILLDLMMPYMDGWAFRIKQRESAALSDVPTIAMSANSTSQAIAIDADLFVADVDVGGERGDYVLACGRGHTVADFAREAFACVGLDSEEFGDVVTHLRRARNLVVWMAVGGRTPVG